MRIVVDVGGSILDKIKLGQVVPWIYYILISISIDVVGCDFCTKDEREGCCGCEWK